MPVVAVTGGSIVGIGGLWLAYQSNVSLENQTATMAEQTALMQKQTEIMSQNAEAELRTTLIDVLYQHAPPRPEGEAPQERPLPSADLGIAAFSHRARAEALREFVELERRRLRDEDQPRINVTYALLDHVDASGFDLNSVDLSAADLTVAHLVGTDLSKATLHSVNLSGALLCPGSS